MTHPYPGMASTINTTNGWIDLGTYDGTGLISWGSGGTGGTIYTTTTNTISFTTPTYYQPLTNNYYTYNTAPAEETDEAREERLQREEAGREEYRRREAEYRRREAERLARQREEVQARQQAEERAEELLLSFLTEEQRQTRREHGYFDIEGSHGGRYRIQNGYSGNVIWMEDEGVIGGRFCAHPDMRDGLPIPDAMLAQMLHLTTDEADFIRISNLQHGRRPTHLEAAA